MRDGPPSYRSASPVPGRPTAPPMRSSSPMRGGEYSSTSTLLQEISTLRARLKDLEEDTKSSVVSAGAGVADENSPLVIMLRKDLAQLEQEKAVQEKEFLNQISSMQKDHQRRMNELSTKLRETELLNEVLNSKLQTSAMEADELRDVLDRSINDDADFFKARLREAKAEIEELSDKVQKAVKDGEASRSKTETEDKYLRLLEEARENHVKEIEQMKENLASADMEITECRGEIDALQEEVFELQQYREALLEEVTSSRVDCSDEKRQSQQLKVEVSKQKLTIEKLKHEVKERDIRLDQKFEEIARLKKNSTASADVKKLHQEIDAKNETITRLEKELEEKKQTVSDLQSQKDALLSEVTEMKLKLQEAAEAVKAQLTVDTAVDGSSEPPEPPITPAEKRQLLDDVQTLEDRLVRFHSKLADKDCKIEGLQESLTDERKVNKQLRAEIRQLRSEIPPQGQSNVPASPGHKAELLRLRDENKQLTQELKVLRDKTDSNFNKSKKAASQPVIAPPPALKRTTPAKTGYSSPRTPVSGLVSHWERGFNNRNKLPGDPTDSPTVSSDDDSLEDSLRAPHRLMSAAQVSDLQGKLQKEKELVDRLQREVQSDKEAISSLQDQLRKQERMASELQKKIDRCGSPTSLSKELQESRLKIERLEDALIEAGQAQSRRDKALASSTDQSETYKQTIAALQAELQKLQSELKATTQKQFVSNNEKSTPVEADELASLRAQVMKKEKALARMRSDAIEAAEQKEELSLLRTKVTTLQSELDNAMATIDELGRSIRNETTSRVNAAERMKAEYDAGIERMELELTMTKARHAELESEHEAKVKELQTKIRKLAQTNLDLSLEVPAEAQTQFDEQIDKLTEDLMNCQMRMADMEMEYSLKIKDLEGKLKSKKTELEEMQKEIDSLQQALQLSATNGEKEANLHKQYDAEINRLSVQLTHVQMSKAEGDMVHMQRLKELEAEIESLESEAEKELDAKQVEIDALKKELQHKEVQISNLESERTQLCTNIKDVSFSRKEEMQELQDELLDLTTKTKSQAREIEALKLKIHEFESRKENVAALAQKRIHELEEQVREREHMGRDNLIELKAENMQLRETIRDVKLERRSLKERLEALTQDKSTSKSAQVLRERNNVLKTEVEKLTKRLKKMEDSITRFAI